jgi:hypothetical protein
MGKGEEERGAPAAGETRRWGFPESGAAAQTSDCDQSQADRDPPTSDYAAAYNEQVPGSASTHTDSSSPNGFTHLLVVQDEDLDEVVARYDRLRSLDRNDAFDACIGFVVETLSRSVPPDAATTPALRDWGLGNWLVQHAGSRPRKGEELAAWWERHRAEDPRARLLAALGWELSPEALRPELLLERFHQTEFRTNANTLPWIHNLLTLTVDGVSCTNPACSRIKLCRTCG